ncbi:hypothetical protein H696_00491 [Fonticula alba]|uniref:COMM domain-containing protein n=1 Tax=Fonticula alba TaxID=691883 RepID=A0A058ZG73_FONAL|nr:hypothetical protein H696_00491 [Fonticula alba]KCV72928.1 hypothetical protein H696_00491 [Fonticula alba]|eukprot:XP_009492629.1 hypothetical protein H696_00491 [Fonticula alba]
MARYSDLKLLLGGPYEDILAQMFKQVFIHSRESTDISTVFPSGFLKRVAEQFQISPQDASNLLDTIADLIDDVLFVQCGPAEIVAMLPGSLPVELRQFVAAAISHSIPEWKDILAGQEITHPRLVASSMKVHVKTASSVAASLSEPVVIAQLDIQPTPESDLALDVPVRKVVFEMDKDTLGSLLDGFGRLREQLSAFSSGAAQ